MPYPIRSVPDGDTNWGPDLRATIAGVNDHQTRITALESGGTGGGGNLNRVVEVNGVYPARPSTGYTDFLGITDPTAFMQTGDTWTELPPTAPNAPTIGTATGGNAQASVAFTAPSWNGGASITGYTAKSTPGNITGTGSSSPITVTGLTNGTAYTFTVHATNSVGNSAESAASNSVTPSAGAPTVPGAPTIGTATTGVTSASITFTPPASNGGATITSYTAKSTPGNITRTLAASPITVTGLTAGTAYTFTVHATNSVGNSAESAASNSVTPTAGGAGGSLPTVSTGTLFAQFKADALGLSDGASVTTWTKSAGTMTGNLASTGTAPVFKTGQLNGFPSVRFSAGYFDAPSAGTLTQPFTEFVVCRLVTDQGDVTQDLVTSSTGANTAALVFNGYNNDFELRCPTQHLGPAGNVLTDGNVLEAVANGTSSIMAVNGTNASFLDDAGTNGMTGLRVGADVNGDVDSIYQGDIFEVIVYAGSLSLADRTSIRQYLGTKYGITVS